MVFGNFVLVVGICVDFLLRQCRWGLKFISRLVSLVFVLELVSLYVFESDSISMHC